MIVEILFILHVVNGIILTNHNFEKVYLHEFKYKYYYFYSYICMNKFNCSFYFYKYYFVNFSKMVTDTGLNFST